MARKSSEIPVHVQERIISLQKLLSNKNYYSYRKIGEIVKLNFSIVRYIVMGYEKSDNMKNKSHDIKNKSHQKISHDLADQENWQWENGDISLKR